VFKSKLCGVEVKSRYTSAVAAVAAVAAVYRSRYNSVLCCVHAVQSHPLQHMLRPWVPGNTTIPCLLDSLLLFSLPKSSGTVPSPLVAVPFNSLLTLVDNEWEAQHSMHSIKLYLCIPLTSQPSTIGYHAPSNPRGNAPSPLVVVRFTSRLTCLKIQRAKLLQHAELLLRKRHHAVHQPSNPKVCTPKPSVTAHHS
jgi:hypothetical protein